MTQFVHQVWKTEQGLPQKTVNDILQTKDGYLWLASPESLSRFDGLKFTVFESRYIRQIKARNLPKLAEDHAGNLWIATEGAGLARYKNGNFQSFTTQNGLSDNSVLSVTVDPDGSLWIGTQWGGLDHLQNGKITVYTAKNGTPGNRINALYFDERGDLWVGGDGLSRFHNGTFTIFPKDGLASNLITSITSDRKGTVWVGTWGGGVGQFQNGKFLSFTTTEGLSSNEIKAIYYDTDGNLWVGTRQGGLCRFKDGNWETYSQAQGLSDRGVRTIYEDREGSLWIGTYNQGLDRLKDGDFITYSSEEGLPNDEVQSIYEDRHGTFWLGTQNGVVRFSEGKFESFGREQGLSATNVTTADGDSMDQLWVGTRGGGVFVLKDGRFTSFPLLKGSPYLFINCVYVDRSDNVWVGTADGLIGIRKGNITHYTIRDGLAHSSVSCVFEDRSGNLWVGTRGGLSRLRNNRFQSFRTETGVICIHEDHQGVLWIGTWGGLCRFENEKFKVYTISDGLYDDRPAAIMDDDAGNLWITSSKGIFRINKTDILNYDKGSVRSITSVSYGLADGLKDNEFFDGDPSVWKTKDGRLWFPTLKGFTVIDPAKINHRAVPPGVMIEGFYADQRYYDPAKKELIIPPGKKRLEFIYTGLALFAPERVRFQYKLEGYDREWTDAAKHRSATYTNIPPGNYTFRVKARSDDAGWNEPGAAIVFNVLPRFYQTKWFYLLCAGAVVLTVLGTHQRRVKRMRSEFKAVLEERSRIAREIHDSLAQALAAVVMQLEAAQLKPSPEQSKDHVERALNLARMSVVEARRTVVGLRQATDHETDLASTLKEEALRQTAHANLELKFAIKGEPRILPEAQRANLARIVSEAVHNVVKHARAKSVDILLAFDPQNVTLEIKDDGCGFDSELVSKKSGHFGFTGMRERVSSMGGVIQIQSQPEQGAEIRVTLPIKPTQTPRRG